MTEYVTLSCSSEFRPCRMACRIAKNVRGSGWTRFRNIRDFLPKNIQKSRSISHRKTSALCGRCFCTEPVTLKQPCISFIYKALQFTIQATTNKEFQDSIRRHINFKLRLKVLSSVKLSLAYGDPRHLPKSPNVRSSPFSFLF